MTEKVEYRVRPITRYVVTRFHSSKHTGGVEDRGTYENEDVAHEVAYALCKAEHDASDEPEGSDKFRYPQRASECAKVIVQIQDRDEGPPYIAAYSQYPKQPGENYNRGNDLADGALSDETLDRVMKDIAAVAVGARNSYEMQTSALSYGQVQPGF